MDEITVKLSLTEIQQLVSLIDIAVKATGLEGGMMAVPLVQKIQAAKAAAEQAPPKRKK